MQHKTAFVLWLMSLNLVFEIFCQPVVVQYAYTNNKEEHSSA